MIVRSWKQSMADGQIWGTQLYNGPRNVNTEKGRDKIYSKHDEKTVYSSFQGQSRPGTSQRREDYGANRRRI
ncbi:MAG: hypothetical protein NVSMB27_23270 [Ktedonobacteraceae bacterium]